MNSRWMNVVSASLVAFALLVIAWQFYPWNEYEPYSSIGRTFIRGNQESGITNLVERNQPSSGSGPALNLVMPKEARVFMPNITTGPANNGKMGYFYSMTYYLFPREIGVSVDQPARQTQDGFLGRPAESDQEILTRDMTSD